MWRGASTAMAERSHILRVTRLFYTLAVLVTFIHSSKGIPWTQEKVGLNKSAGLVHIL